MTRREERRNVLRTLGPKFGYTLVGDNLVYDKSIDIITRINMYKQDPKDYETFVRAAKTQTLDTLRDQKRNATKRLERLESKANKTAVDTININTIKKQITVIEQDIKSLKEGGLVRGKKVTYNTGKALDNMYKRSVYNPSIVGKKSTTKSIRDNFEANAIAALVRGTTRNGYEVTLENKETLEELLKLAGVYFKDIIESAADYTDMYEGLQMSYISGVNKLEANIDSLKREEALEVINNNPKMLELLYLTFGNWEAMK